MLQVLLLAPIYLAPLHMNLPDLIKYKINIIGYSNKNHNLYTSLCPVEQIFGIVFIAYTLRVTFSLTSSIFPKFPLPIKLTTEKSFGFARMVLICSTADETEKKVENVHIHKNKISTGAFGQTEKL
jgi:hypothetical protein